MPTVHLIIKGKVQGVFYKTSAKKEADSLHVTGWVKNTRNGDVEAMASGNVDAIERFIAWCKQGPPRAMVTDVAVTKQAEQAFGGFAILRD